MKEKYNHLGTNLWRKYVAQWQERLIKITASCLLHYSGERALGIWNETSANWKSESTYMGIY